MNEAFDFVVVGSGGGSMCAALVMRSLGKSVLILEKTEYVGGITARSGGVMWVPDNRFMKRAGVADSHDRAMAYMDATVGAAEDIPGATRERRLAYVEEAPKMLDFLVDQGIKLRRIPTYPDYYSAAPGASDPGRTVVAELFDANLLGEWKGKLRPGFLPLPAKLDEAMMLPRLKKSWAAKRTLMKVGLRGMMAKLTGKHLVTAGNALQGRMLRAALDAGVDIRVDSPVKQIIVEGGRATGVTYMQDGAEKRVDAKLGVLINAGGFSHNQAMLDRFIPGISKEWSMAPDIETGEMIEEAVRVGGVTAQMDVRVCHPTAMPPGRPAAGVHGDLAKPHSIIVDQSGERYMAEAASYMDLCNGMVARDKIAPAVPSWLVMDSRYLRNYMLAGSMPGLNKPEPWFESGFLRKSGTLEELASACGMDVEKLKASVDRFNGFAKAGEDKDFGRGRTFAARWLGDPDGPAPTLGTIEEGPFFAMQVFPGDVGTFGGVITDVNARVLRADGTPIEGLYATGTSTASVMGRTSVGPGSSIGPSFTWGYVAAKHAAHADNRMEATTP